MPPQKSRKATRTDPLQLVLRHSFQLHRRSVSPPPPTAAPHQPTTPDPRLTGGDWGTGKCLWSNWWKCVTDWGGWREKTQGEEEEKKRQSTNRNTIGFPPPPPEGAPN